MTDFRKIFGRLNKIHTLEQNAFQERAGMKNILQHYE